MGDREPLDGVLGRAMFATGALCVAVVDAVGRILRANPGLERLTGYADAELRGRHLRDLLHADDAPVAARLLGAPPGDARDRAGEVRVRTRVDVVHWVKLTVAPAPAATPHPAVVILEDLTLRRDLALRLTERVKELSALHQAARILGDVRRPRDARLADLARMLPAAMQHPALATACLTVGDARVATPGHRPSPWRLAARGETMAGERLEVEVAYHAPLEGARDPFLTEEHALLVSLAELVGHALDRDATAQAQARHELALAAAGLAVWEWDLATDTAHWSRELAELTGEWGPLAAPTGARDHVIHADDRAALWDVVRRLADEGGQVEALRVRLRRADGAWRTMQLSLRGPGDQRVVAALRDVTPPPAGDDAPARP